MKATYFAAAVAVALAGMSGTAHAAFTVNATTFSPDQGTPGVLDTAFDSVTFTFQNDDSEVNNEVLGPLVFNVTLPAITGGAFGVALDGSGIDFGDVFLNDSVVSSGGTGFFGFTAGTPPLEDGSNELKITIDNASVGALGDASVTAVPLPAAAWLMIGGLGAVGAYARRSRKTAPTA